MTSTLKQAKKYKQIGIPIELRDILNQQAVVDGRKVFAAFARLLHDWYFSDRFLGGLTLDMAKGISEYLISYNGELSAISIEPETYQLLESCAAQMRSEYPEHRGSTVRSVRSSNLAWALIMQKHSDNDNVQKLLRVAKD